MKLINYYKNKWKREYSSSGNLIEVDYSLIKEGMENLEKNSFCSKELVAKLLEKRATYKTYHYGFAYNGTEYHLYFYGKNPPAKSFYSKVVMSSLLVNDECEAEGKPKNISVLFCDTRFKKVMPAERGEVIGCKHVNSGSTTFTSSDSRFIHIWRKEECFKVYLHELLHAFNVENSSIRDPLIVEPLMRHFNVDIPLLLVGEAYVEAYATFINLIFYHVVDKNWSPKKGYTDTENEIAESFSYEVEFATFQIAKLLYHFGYQTTGKFYNKKGTFKIPPKWKEDSNVFSYYIIKWGLLCNICKMLETCEKKYRLPCRIHEGNIDNFFDIIVRSWNKKRFTTVINKYIREMRHRKTSYKYIGNTLRMTVYG